jgi:AraC-like DNA-binding protein
MQYREFAPHATLADTVKCFWIHEGSYSPEQTQEITPDGCVELIVNFGSAYWLLNTTPPTVLPTAFIVGFQNRTIRIRVDGTVKVVAARLFAWAARTLLQFEVEAITHAVTGLAAPWDALVQQLEAEVTEGRYDRARIALQEFLLQKALLRSYEPRVVQAAAKHLHCTKGQCRIEEVADCCHMSIRQLERSFQQGIGASPKLFARTLRFQHAQERLMFDPETDLTRLAHDCGYFDQAHFIKDFKEFSAQTPTEYIEKMRQMQKILKNKDVVFLQSAPRSSG